ncbi:MAG TPA: methyltransferase domain-containing protein [Gemmatimonadaceae bacterium]|jgi:SAM-dependent methyltransferase|nr:methyltransferase domain-containing protein [Gemmatimonadaceae bacterium]
MALRLPGLERIRDRALQRRRHARAKAWIRNGRVPGAGGYSSARWCAIERALAAPGAQAFGHDDAGLDERVVEYPWALQQLRSRRDAGAPILDAGSVLNHPRLLAYCRKERLGPISLVTLHFEGSAEVSDDVRYEFADLRHLPYRDGWFSSVLCLSTLEHVGMDNRIYGDHAHSSDSPRTETARAMEELRRVTRPGGALLVSVPFGTRDDRGWFRIFDAEDVRHLTDCRGWRTDRTSIYRATAQGWRECSAEAAESAGYNERRRDVQAGSCTAPEWVSAAEAVALLELTAVG